MRTTIYLPDDLHDQVKAAHLNVSAVCQRRSPLAWIAATITQNWFTNSRSPRGNCSPSSPILVAKDQEARTRDSRAEQQAVQTHSCGHGHHNPWALHRTN